MGLGVARIIMDKDVVAQEERGQRILIVVDKYPADFTGVVPDGAVTEIRDALERLKNLPVDRGVGADTSSGAIGVRRGLVNATNKELRALRRTFDQLKKRDVTVTGDLKLPDDRKDDTIMASARTAIELLTPLVPKFVARGKKPTFLDTINADVALFDALTTTSQTGHMNQVTATSKIGEAVHDLVEAYENLDDFVENFWEDETDRLAEWHRAEKLGKIQRNPGAVNPAP